MKIAIIVFPSNQEALATPPLPAGYVAALFEQQRHIVRIYDLALEDATSLHAALAPVRLFRPHAIVVAADVIEQCQAVHQELFDSCNAAWALLSINLRGAMPGQIAVRALHHFNGDAETNFVAATLLMLREQLDTLPFPARHLLRLEGYPLTTTGGSLQTNILTGQFVDGAVLVRNPRLIIAELRSVIHEYGIWHFVFEGLPLTADMAWLNDFVYDLVMARLGISWEATVDPTALSPELLSLLRRAGCETLNIEFDAMQVIDAASSREALVASVREAHVHDIKVRGHVLLEPRYSSIPALVDMSATFGLDDARFSILQPTQNEPSDTLTEPEQLLTLAQSRYQTLQGRQLFVNRFGAYLGPMIWRLRRIGPIGRFWRRYAASDVA